MRNATFIIVLVETSRNHNQLGSIRALATAVAPQLERDYKIRPARTIQASHASIPRRRYSHPAYPRPPVRNLKVTVPPSQTQWGLRVWDELCWGERWGRAGQQPIRPDHSPKQLIVVGLASLSRAPASHGPARRNNSALSVYGGRTSDKIKREYLGTDTLSFFSL